MTHPVGDATARRRFLGGSIWWSVPGVQMTFTINIATLAAAAVLFARS